MSKFQLDNHSDEMIVESFNKGNDYFFEMATVKGGFNNIKIAIMGKEGNLPHFHFYHGVPIDKSIRPDQYLGGGCICFLRAKYFKHGNHTDEMSKPEIEGLIKFLKRKHNDLPYTNWEHMITLWNESNPDIIQIKLTQPIPLYTADMESIHDN